MSSTNLARCDACGGFIPSSRRTCPHCSSASRRPLFDRLRVGALGGAVGGGAIAFTLMACYGGPPCQDDNSCPEPNPVDRDAGSGQTDASLRDAVRPDVQIGGEAGPKADAASDASPSDAGLDEDAD